MLISSVLVVAVELIYIKRRPSEEHPLGQSWATRSQPTTEEQLIDIQLRWFPDRTRSRMHPCLYIMDIHTYTRTQWQTDKRTYIRTRARTRANAPSFRPLTAQPPRGTSAEAGPGRSLRPPALLGTPLPASKPAGVGLGRAVGSSVGAAGVTRALVRPVSAATGKHVTRCGRVDLRPNCYATRSPRHVAGAVCGRPGWRRRWWWGRRHLLRIGLTCASFTMMHLCTSCVIVHECLCTMVYIWSSVV